MKIAWIFPQNTPCGIAFYSRKYIQGLLPFIEIVCLDPMDFITKKADFLKALQGCSLCHIQYETSFYLFKNKDMYSKLCNKISCPIVVTLHEVYEQFPDVFPREKIKGNVLTKLLKEIIYDMRHPYVTAFSRHLSREFNAHSIIVHTNYQKEIVIKKGIDPQKITVLPIPINEISEKPLLPIDSKDGVRLAATGFINPSYNFELLFKALDLCNFPWIFTWIGGVRRPEDHGLLYAVRVQIAKRGWESRFSITGGISNEKRDELLSQAHVYCALFKHKSSSESLANALCAGVPIIATDLPLVNEMTLEFPTMLIVSHNPLEVARGIKSIASDPTVREGLVNAGKNYLKHYGVSSMARRMVSLYERLAAL